MVDNIVIDGNVYSIRRLTGKDEPKLQDLCERCFEFSLMSDGKMPDKNAGYEILNDLPPGKELKDKHVFGVFDKNSILIAVIDMVKDFKVQGEWTIGLLMIDPKERGKSLGTKIHCLIKDWVAAKGGSSLRIGVIEENYRGLNFWIKLGYKELFRKKQSFEKKEHNIIVMSLSLGGYTIADTVVLNPVE